jgi:hypothetical protein
MSQPENTITGQGILEQWNISLAELSYQILKHDLTVLKPSGIPLLRLFVQPKTLRSDSEQLLKIIRDDYSKLNQMLFLVNEVKKIPKKKKPIIEEKSESKSGPLPQYHIPKDKIGPKPKAEDRIKAVIEDHDDSIKDFENVFSLLGKAWFVKFKQDEWGLYPDQEKYRYIAHLLNICDGHPKVPDTEGSIYNTDLVAKVKGAPTGNEPNDTDGAALKELSESDLADKLTADEVEHFKDQGYDLLEHLRAAREGGNEDRIKKAQDNIAAYRSYLFNQYGIKAVIGESKVSFHKLYRPAKELEKLRQLVKNQINKAVKDFDTMPRFKSHLEHSVKMKSSKTFYAPELPTSWYVSI